MRLFSKIKNIEIKSTHDGNLNKIESLKDGVFSEKIMGDGIIISPPKTANKIDVLAPLSGKLITVFPTGHAFGIKTKSGQEILIHIGIDTVNLKGKGFNVKVNQGDDIKVGESMVSVDLSYLRKNIKTIDTIVIVTSGHKIIDKQSGEVKSGEVIFQVS